MSSTLHDMAQNWAPSTTLSDWSNLTSSRPAYCSHDWYLNTKNLAWSTWLQHLLIPYNPGRSPACFDSQLIWTKIWHIQLIPIKMPVTILLISKTWTVVAQQISPVGGLTSVNGLHLCYLWVCHFLYSMFSSSSLTSSPCKPCSHAPRFWSSINLFVEFLFFRSCCFLYTFFVIHPYTMCNWLSCLSVSMLYTIFFPISYHIQLPIV